MNLRNAAKDYNNVFGFNVIPLEDKAPKFEWKKYQIDEMTNENIDSLNWNHKTNGIGAISGINDLRCLDFDVVEDVSIVYRFAEALGYGKDYIWIVKSGSGKGYHIWFYCSDEDNYLDGIGGEKSYYKFNLTENNLCDHIELRWKNCQTVLPPSLHPSGNEYQFVNLNECGLPEDEPNNVWIGKLLEVLKKFCVIDASTTHSINNNTGDKIYYDKERLEAALDYLSENLPEGSYEEWYRIGFALVPLGEKGEKLFVDFSLKNPNYKDTEDNIKKKFESLTADYDGSVTIGSIYHIAELYGWKKPIIRFWFRENSGRISISRPRFKKFLEGEGFCKYKLENNYVFVRIENNIVEEIDSVHVKEYVMNYLYKTNVEEFGDVSRNEIIDALIKSNAQLFTQQFFEFLITRAINFNKDTAETAYLYYKNGFVQITKSKTARMDYTQLENAIWKQQILDRKFETSENRTDFEDFLFNICSKDIKRYEALKSSIGYLLHQYKNPTVAKAIVFIDEKLSEGAFGRSGKGLVIKAIGHIRNIVIEDGRNFNPSKNFAFQRVKVDTDILALEDIREKFPFERLFAIITDGIVIERKNKDEIFIPFNESPKLAISTNFSVKGVDDSTLDRQFIIEFSDYYNKNHRPIDDFGKLFFQGWDVDEWNYFDNFMLECLQFYLRNGLVEYDFVNIEAKKLIDETCAEFAEFSDDLTLDTNYDKKELYKKFKEEYEDYDKLTQGKFTRWLKTWARIEGNTVEEAKSGAVRTISFKEKSKAA